MRCSSALSTTLKIFNIKSYRSLKGQIFEFIKKILSSLIFLGNNSPQSVIFAYFKNYQMKASDLVFLLIQGSFHN